MKNFINKLFLFLLPILLLGLSMEILLRNIPNDYRNKKEYLDQHADELRVIFLGSSHALYGVNPEYIKGKAFNAANRSQSLDLDEKILMKYKNSWKQLEFIVIPIDYFTLFLRLSKAKNNWRIKNYNLYYGFHLSNKLSDFSEVLKMKFAYNLRRLISYYFLKKVSLSSELGFGINDNTHKNFVQNGIIASNRHTYYPEYPNYQKSVEILNRIIDYANQKDIYILFYTSPADIEYKKNLNKEQLDLTIKTVESLTKHNPNCSYTNFLNNQDFSRLDFRDSDHLNSKGALKLTKKIDSVLLKITSNISK